MCDTRSWKNVCAIHSIFSFGMYLLYIANIPFLGVKLLRTYTST